MFQKLIKQIAPVAAIALSAALAGCGDVDIDINGESGVPLAELDMSGDTPTELVLAGPDKIIVTDGSKLDIDVSGDAKAVDLVRFTLKGGTLGVLRDKGKWADTGHAIIKVTMPAPKSVTIAGSGSVEAAGMADDADVNILGSGSLKVAELRASKLDVTVAGSGSFSGSGRADRLDLNILGSGKADMAGVRVDRADVTVAGSGDAAFASDGKVEASILGSGTVRVIGRATCEVTSMGSGKIVCENVSETPDQAKTETKKAKKQASKKSDKKSRKA